MERNPRSGLLKLKQHHQLAEARSTEKPVDSSLGASHTTDNSVIEGVSMNDIYFPPRELAVMSVLWRLGSASVTEVRDALEEDLAYTSVLSALQTLEEKGYVR